MTEDSKTRLINFLKDAKKDFLASSTNKSIIRIIKYGNEIESGVYLAYRTCMAYNKNISSDLGKDFPKTNEELVNIINSVFDHQGLYTNIEAINYERFIKNIKQEPMNLAAELEIYIFNSMGKDFSNYTISTSHNLEAPPPILSLGVTYPHCGYDEKYFEFLKENFKNVEFNLHNNYTDNTRLPLIIIEKLLGDNFDSVYAKFLINNIGSSIKDKKEEIKDLEDQIERLERIYIDNASDSQKLLYEID